MTMTELLAQLGEKNVGLSVKGDDLVVSGEEQVLEAPELIDLLRKHKKALVEHIKAGRYVDPKGIVQVPPNRIPPGCEAITPEMLPLAQLTQPEIDSIVGRVPGGAPNVQDIYPLAPLQEGMLFHHLVATEGDVYLNLSLLAFDTRDRLDSFLQSLQAVIDRNDTLRMAVLWEGMPEPVQVVWRRAPLAIEEISLDPAAGDVADELSARFDPRRYRLDVRQAPLTRIYIAHDARKDRWVMALLFHHLQGDHTMFDVLLQEIQAHLLGRAAQLPEPLPLRNFIAQARLGVSRQEHEAFFRQMLGDVDEPTAPYGLIDVLGDGPGIGVGRRKVEAGLSVRLRRRARRLGVRAASLCHLAWAQVLGRVSGRDDVVFGTVMLGRMQGVEGAQRALGMLINTLPIRIRVGAASVEDSARQTHQLLTELTRHEHASLALAQRCSAVAAPAPLFSAIFNYRYIAAAETVAGVAEDAFRAWEGIEFLAWNDRNNYPFSLHVDDLGEEFELVAEAQSPIDPDRICTYMHTVLGHLVEALEHAPMTPVRSLNVLPDSERHQLLVEWNSTEAEYSHNRCVHELFGEQAELTPERIALISERDQVSYRELNRRANQLGHYLRGLGVGSEVVVGLCLGRSVEMVVAMMGALKAGGAYLPLDPESPLERLGYMLEDAGAAVVLTERKLEERLPAFGGLAVLMDEDWERIGEECESELEGNVEAENLAYVIYTSGSTGRPKGVMINHRGLVNYLKWATEAYRIEEGEGAPVQSSISFDLTVTSLYGPLVNGKRVDLLSEEEGIEALATALSRERDYSLVKLTPAHLELLAQQLGNSEVEGRAKALVIGGEELKVGGLKFWQEKAPGTRLINEYGPTETVVGCCVYEVNGSESGRESAPIGKPIANTQMYVLDQGVEPAPIGVRGEICVSGAGLGRGYVRRPELTGEKFIPNPFGKHVGERLYKTGDVGRYLSNGNIEYVGRRDDQVKLRGYRVELGEIQAVLEEHRSVRQSVIVVSEDERGGKRLLGYVVGEEGATPAELKRHVRERLPEYMTPDAIMVLEELPLTANGKIDRKRLPSLKDAGRQLGQKYVAPLTPVEEIVAGIFGEVLMLDRVGREDNFFELGGHSLLATQVISRVRNAFGVEIGVGSVFEKATTEGLASRIEEAIRAGETEKAPPLVKVSRDGHLPLSFAQQRLWFLDQLVPNNSFYNVPSAVRLAGRLDIQALERVINEILRRHEVLRTRIEVEAGAPVQVIDEWEPRRLEVVDLKSLTPEEREEAARRMTRAEAELGFDLRRGPMLRVKALELGMEEHIVLFTMHHIVSDGWSMGILIKEVEALYHAFIKGEESPLPELDIQYADFAVWQRNWLQGEALERRLSYWREQLAGLEPLELPTDYPRSALASYRGASSGLELPEELTEGLQALSRREGVTLFMTLLAAFQALLMRYSGQEDVAVGSAIANRTRADIEALIGFFANTLVLRTQVEGKARFQELLGRVREVCLQAYAHQDVPFEKLVEELQPARAVGETPLFQIMFIFQNVPEPTLEMHDLTLTSEEDPDDKTKFDLCVVITETGRRLRLSFLYSAELFSSARISRMIGHFKTLLTSIVENPDLPISKLPMLTTEESQAILSASKFAKKRGRRRQSIQRQDV